MNHSMQINARTYFEVCGFSYMVIQLVNHVSKEQCASGEYTKRRAPGRRKLIDRGLFGGLKGRGPGRRLGMGLKNKRPCAGPLSGKGRGIGVCAQRLRSPGGPVTNTIQVDQTVLHLVELKWHRQQIHCAIYLGFAQSVGPQQY